MSRLWIVRESRANVRPLQINRATRAAAGEWDKVSHRPYSSHLCCTFYPSLLSVAVRQTRVVQCSLVLWCEYITGTCTPKSTANVSCTPSTVFSICRYTEQCVEERIFNTSWFFTICIVQYAYQGVQLTGAIKILALP